MSISTPSQPESLPALTGLRAVAALMVVLFHFGSPVWSLGPVWLQTVCGHGGLAVGLFFFLSGFILTLTYVGPGRLARQGRGPYFLARFARVYPLFFAAMLLGLAFGIFPGLTPAHLAAQLSLTHAWVITDPAFVSKGNYPAWSLSAEAFFYLLFPFLPFERWRHWRPVALGALTLLIGLSSAVVAAVLLAAFGYTPNSMVHLVLFFFPPMHAPIFLTGVLTGLLYLRGLRLGAAAWFLPELSVLLAYGVLTLALKKLPYGWILLNAGLLFPAFALLVVGLTFGRSPLARLLGSPAGVLLGKASYAVYLLHVPIWMLLASWNLRGALGLSAPAYFGLYMAVLIAVSIAAYYGIEQPARNALQRRFKPERRPDEAVPPAA